MCSQGSEHEPSHVLMHNVKELRALGVDQKVYWEFYCTVMRAVNYDHKESRAKVSTSILIPILHQLYPRVVAEDGSVAWNKSKVRRTFSHDILGLLHAYIAHEYGEKWTQLNTLIDAFEDRDEFAKDPTRFGWLCLEDAKGENIHGASEWARSDYVPSDDDGADSNVDVSLDASSNTSADEQDDEDDDATAI